jgi:predicted nucleotidyltransferase component of viral defense system
MIKWLAIPDETKVRAYNQVAEKTGISPFAVEKDWWVVQTLTFIFQTQAAQNIVFKGGTSLSKGWNLINRFSEDIDLAINKELFGFSGMIAKHQRDKIRKTAGKYIDQVFFPEIEALFLANGFTGVNFQPVPGKASDRDRILKIYYPNIIKPTEYLEAKVQIEVTSRSLREPFTDRMISSFIDDIYSEQDFTMPPISIPCVNPERTFLEKLFLLQEEFQRPAEKRRVDRLSRHIYDVVKLSETEYADKALSEPLLYETILEHRYHFGRISGVNYNLHKPHTLNPVPGSDEVKDWEADYKKMALYMIHEENPPSFSYLLEELNRLKTRINSLLWDIKNVYPVPEI